MESSTNTLNRRSVLKWLALSTVAPSIDACARVVPTPSVASPYPHLARVRVGPERIIRQGVGLRPFRRSGFRVAAESLGDKTLIHNYGHGGGGMSLSWGSADLA